MKRIAILLTFLISLNSALALDLDREKISVAYTKLPTNPISDVSQRTYAYDIGTSYRPNVVLEFFDNQFQLHGFQRVNENPNLLIKIYFDGILFNVKDIKTRVQERKDSEGNVKKTYYYQPFIRYSANATVDVSYANGQSKRFMFGSNQYEHFGPESSSRYAANSYFDGNIYQLKTQFYREFVADTVAEINSKLNNRHGYSPKQYDASLLILDSKRYDEYKDYKKYYRLIRTAFSQMTPFESVESIENQIKPAMEFLAEIPNKYPKKKRAHKKMRYASFYNLAILNLYLDNLDEAETYFQKVVDNDYREGESERMLNTVNDIRSRMEINNVDSRHFILEYPQ